MAACDLSAEYRIGDGGVALESAGNVERSQWERLLYGLFHTDGNDSLLLWIFAAASGNDAQRRNRERRFFAPYGRRSEYLLEEQSLSHATFYWRKRFAPSAVGDS